MLKNTKLNLILISLLILLTSCTTNEDLNNTNKSIIKTGIEDIAESNNSTSFKLPDSGQEQCYGLKKEIECPDKGEAFYGQDAQYTSNGLQYKDNGDGTISDLNTGLMWAGDLTVGQTFVDANSGVTSYNVGGYNDWRVPTIKELYSLITFDGTDPSGYSGDDTGGLIPFIDTDYFDFEYGGGGGSSGNRIIDVQGITSTMYESTVMDGEECFFGVNFADGRIKCYSLGMPGQYFRILYVRGDNGYGENKFIDNGNETVTDEITGLTWQQNDSGEGMTWEVALNYCSNLSLAGRNDWRLPNTKELQYIVDYSRSPDTTDSATIDPIFSVSEITNEANEKDYPFYWTSTTHKSFVGANAGAYVSFGRSLGYQNGEWIDVHGAGSQRSDPKNGNPDDYPTGNGPQGDSIRIYNYVRCVTGGDVTFNNDVKFTDSAYLNYYEGYKTTEMESTPVEKQATPPNTQGTNTGINNKTTQRQGPPPNNTQGGQMMGAPVEAIIACENKTEGDACSFTGMQGSISGTCGTQDNVFACAPEGMK